MLDLHPTESLASYDGGSCVMLWEIVEDIKLRVHEHLNPVRVIRFFGEKHKFIFSCDYRTMIISEWHSLNRVAELTVPLKKNDSPCGNMIMDYRENTMTLLMQLQQGYKLTILSFKEFSLRFVFAADFSDSMPLMLRMIDVDSTLSILTVAVDCAKIYKIADEVLLPHAEVAVHKPVLSAAVFEEKREVVLLTEEGLLVSLNFKVGRTDSDGVSQQACGQLAWSVQDCSMGL